MYNLFFILVVDMSYYSLGNANTDDSFTLVLLSFVLVQLKVVVLVQLKVIS